MNSTVPAPFEQQFAHDIFKQRYSMNGAESWSETSARVVTYPMTQLYYTPGARSGKMGAGAIQDAADRLYKLHNARQFIAGGRYLYATGRDFHQVNNCVLLRCPDTREGWAETSYQAEMALMTGAGIGVYYGDVREGGALIQRTGGVSSGPVPKMQQVNETGRHTMQGGNRRSAIWAGLPWWHADIFDFMTIKDWSDDIKALKEKDPMFPAPMDMTNISVCLDDSFFHCYNHRYAMRGPSDPHAPNGMSWHDWAHSVYDTAVRHMLLHGEPGFSIDTGDKSHEVLRNACTEITSADDSDVCNLGSLVLSRFGSPQEFEVAVYDAVLFLTAGSLYSDVPYQKVAEVRDMNRRLGLGLIGVHEFLMKRGVKYGSDEALEVLEPYMECYARALEFAHDWQELLRISLSKGATAIAPNGTIGIVGESTPSGDPLYSPSEIRQVKLAHHAGRDKLVQHVVVDPVAQRLVNEGVDPTLIEGAHDVPYERRVRQTAFLQKYVDHAISGTVNLPHTITDDVQVKDFGDTLMRYLPNLRGITVYPDGARAGQPRTSVPLEWALKQTGRVIETDDATCAGGVCGL